MSLVDSSVWVDYLRGTPGQATSYLRNLLRTELPAITEPIESELLAGAGLHELWRLERLIDGLPVLTVAPEFDYRDAAAIYRACKRSGRTVRKLNDCLIAAIALRYDAMLVHKDADFEILADVIPLRHVSLR